MWPICAVCGNRLRLRTLLRSLGKGKKTYPFRKADGTREELPVRWLCGACERRGQKHRETPAETNPDGA